MQPWIVVGPTENFEALRQRKFDVCGFKSSRRKQSGCAGGGDGIGGRPGPTGRVQSNKA